MEQHAARLGDPSGEEPGHGPSGARGKADLESKPIKSWRASAFGPLPDIGEGERFVRDGPITEVRGGRGQEGEEKMAAEKFASRATLLSTPLHA